jgi:hypothetical protein
MSRFLKVIVCVCFIALITVVAHAQSVADAAKQNKDAKKPQASKTYTNEDIPSVEEPAPAEKKDSDGEPAKAEEGKEKAEGENSAEAKSDEKAEGKDAPDTKSIEKEWTGKVNAQKEKIGSLEKERELAEREYKLRAAVFYADAGNRLRDDKKWADSEQKYKTDMAKLDADLSSAKERLETLREQARKAGVKVD